MKCIVGHITVGAGKAAVDIHSVVVKSKHGSDLLLLALGANCPHFRVFSNPSQRGGFGVESLPDKMPALPVSYHLEAFNPAILVEFKFHGSDLLLGGG
jgi:hypothetical protein